MPDILLTATPRFPKIYSPSSMIPPYSTKAPISPPKKSSSATVTLARKPPIVLSSPSRMPTPHHLDRGEATTRRRRPKLPPQSSHTSTPTPTNPQSGRRTHQYDMCKARHKGHPLILPHPTTHLRSSSTFPTLRVPIIGEAAVVRAKPVTAQLVGRHMAEAIPDGPNPALDARLACKVESFDAFLQRGLNPTSGLPATEQAHPTPQGDRFIIAIIHFIAFKVGQGTPRTLLFGWI